MKKAWLVLWAVCGVLSVPCAYAKLNENTVAQHATQAAQPNGLKRFEYMRFFLANNTLPMPIRWWENLFSSYDEQHLRALAIYLFNMHVSTHLYRQSPQILTLNYLGVLDGLVRGSKILNTSQATKLYQKNQKQVNELLRQFIQRATPTWPAPTQAQLDQWLALLERQPRRSNKPVYVFPAQNLLKATVSAQIKAQFESVLTAVLALAQQRAIVYDQPDVKLEDLDHKIGHYQTHRKRTYRWLKEECYYTAYLSGKLVTDQIVHNQLAWNTRVYMLTALPKTGEFLSAAEAERFTLSNGQQSLHWRYHTALLVIVPQEHTYTPIILDPFLAGGTPISLDQWTTAFSQNTVFSAVPFARENSIENALKTPQKKEGNSIWVEGARYEPAPVEK